MKWLKFSYSRIRIGMYTFALGLAAVWMYDGFLIGSEYVSVELPKSNSDEIFQVVLRKPFTNLGGGSGPSAPIVFLKQVPRKDPSRLYFALKNPTEKRIYVPRVPTSDRKNNAAHAHFLVCQDFRGGPIYVLSSGPEFEQWPSELKPDSETVFSVKRPEQARACILIVPYDFWAGAAQRLANDGFLRNTDLYSFRDYIDHYATYTFQLSDSD